MEINNQIINSYTTIKNYKLLSNNLKQALLSVLPFKMNYCNGFKNEFNQPLNNPTISILDTKQNLLNDNIREISLNSSKSFSAIILDVDKPYNPKQIQKLIDLNLIPKPSWITINPKSNHYHVVYLLDNLYLKKYNKNTKRYVATYHYLSTVYHADPAYKGLWTHNPLHTADDIDFPFKLDFCNDLIYKLDDLYIRATDWLETANIELPKHLMNQSLDYNSDYEDISFSIAHYNYQHNKNQSADVGFEYRNNTIFMRCMYFANQNYTEYELKKQALEDAEYYAKHSNKKPLSRNEISNIVKSVLKIHNSGKNNVFKLYDLNGTLLSKQQSYSKFIKLQKERNLKSQKVRQEERDKKIHEMSKMLENKIDKQTICHKLRICKSTYYNYRKIIIELALHINTTDKNFFQSKLCNKFNYYMDYLHKLFDNVSIFNIQKILRQRNPDIMNQLLIKNKINEVFHLLYHYYPISYQFALT